MIPLTWTLSKLLLLCIDMLFSIQKFAFFVLLSTNRLFSMQKSFSAMAVTLCVLCFLSTNRLFPCRSRSLPWPWPFVFCVFSVQTGSFHAEVVLCHGRDPLCFVFSQYKQALSMQKSFSAMAVTLCVLCFLSTNRLFSIQKSFSAMAVTLCVLCFLWTNRLFSIQKSFSAMAVTLCVLCFLWTNRLFPYRSRSLPWPWPFVLEVVLCHGRDPLCFVLHSIRQCAAWGNWHDVRTDQADRGTHHLCSGWRCRLAGAGNKQNMYIFKYI